MTCALFRDYTLIGGAPFSWAIPRHKLESMESLAIVHKGRNKVDTKNA